RPCAVGAARGRRPSARRGTAPPGAPTLQLHAQATDRPLPRRWRTATVWPARIAAAVALLVAGAALWSRRSPPAPPREYATAPGQRAALTLPDGSRVLLSVGTRLLVPRDSGVVGRSVQLGGDAYFVVRHDPGRPFLVRTAHGTTGDLGTEVVVSAFRV